ncbi:indole-3-glycerol phosphate synthase [Bryobacterales bacterium F-183]|nr:indole-3-glycerol phosphate synthase [Bryobacterales bacterium F-183]
MTAPEQQVQQVPDILAKIVAHKHVQLEQARGYRPVVEQMAHMAKNDHRDFKAALMVNPPSVIAEVKKGSPSKGIFTHDFDPVAIGLSYEAGGAAALSVLTDSEFFYGSLQDLERARTAVNIPVLRKDFTIDEHQVYEAASVGADAILLIAAILTVEQMRKFRELAESLGLSALVEVHNDEELRATIDSGATIIGVNNRDLHTFKVSLDTSLRLAEKMPSNAVLVSESGIHSNADVKRLMDAGYKAFLVGEHLMTSGDATAALRALRTLPA